tara:strand:- start:251 stop:637 length:387 start_codon:yes stop_codon:yes gene_type:complete
VWALEIGSKKLEGVILNDKLSKVVCRSLDDDKAENICVINLSGKTTIADNMIIATGRSKRHIISIADRLVECLKSHGIALVGIEGKEQGDWILLDVGDVIVHLFRQEVREFYELEKMWSVVLPETVAT